MSAAAELNVVDWGSKCPSGGLASSDDQSGGDCSAKEGANSAMKNEDFEPEVTNGNDNRRVDVENCNSCDSDAESDISVGECSSYAPNVPPPPNQCLSSPPSCSSSSKSPSPSTVPRTSRSPPSSPKPDDEYFKPLKRLRMVPLQKHEEYNSSKSAPSNDHQVNEPPQQMAVGEDRPTSKNHPNGVKSFSIHDILNHDRQKERAHLGLDPTQGNPLENPHLQQQQSLHIALATRRIVRPWDIEDGDENLEDDGMSVCSSSGSSSAIGSPRPASEGSAAVKGKDGNPLDALFQMTSKTFNVLSNGSSGGKNSSWSHSVPEFQN